MRNFALIVGAAVAVCLVAAGCAGTGGRGSREGQASASASQASASQRVSSSEAGHNENNGSPASASHGVPPSGTGDGESGRPHASAADRVPSSETGDDEINIRLKPTTVSVRRTGIGRVLTDATGRTFYVFSKDRPQRSACIGACARYWRPVLARAGKPKAGPGLDPALIGSMQRADGSYQITYGGMPLYYSPRDSHAGAVNGNGVIAYGGTWTAVKPRPRGK